MTASAPAPDLSRLFAPRSVAFVGATEKRGARSTRLFDCVRDFGYRGRIYAVNADTTAVKVTQCYASVNDLPEVPDHVGVIVPAEEVFGVLAECAARGVPFATVYSEGFAETGTPDGRERQERLVAFARATGMRIMGPNCNGLINYIDDFAMTATSGLEGERYAAGNVGVVSQSGGLGQINVMWRAQEAGLGISYQASCGNEADLDAFDFVRFMLRSDATDVVLLALESIKNGAQLKDVAAEAAERGKPIIVLKYGRTEAGGRAAASHTGAIAGKDEICDAAFRQYGLIRVDDCDELYEMAVFLRKRRWPRGRKAASVSATGGNIVHIADVGANLGISWGEYSAGTQAVLADLMHETAAIPNPTDMNALAKGPPAQFYQGLTAIAGDPNIDVLTPIFVSVSRKTIELGAGFVEQCEKPAALLWVGGCTDEPAFNARNLIAAGFPVYRDALPCLRAMRAAMDFGERIDARKKGADIAQRPAGIDVESAREKLAAHAGPLTERDAKRVLAHYGFPVTRERLATNPDEAVLYAREMAGSVALKIDAAAIAHKTDAGAIRLGLQGDAAVRQGYIDVIEAARRHAPAAAINGVLVQEMVPLGAELMLGIVHDTVFGPVVVAGLGGIYVEVLRDVSYRVAPVTATDARSMLGELRGHKLLEGVRGMAPRDIESVVDLIVRLSWFAHDFRAEISELDINPLVVLEQGCGARVVDALIVRA